MGIILKRKRVRKVVDYFNSDKGVKHIPYGIGVRLIHWFCSTDFSLNEFFKNKTPIVKEFLAHFPGQYDEKETIINFLRLNFLHGWKASSFTNLPDSKYFKRLKLKGYDIFLDHYNKKKGVVLLNSHYGLPVILISMFPALKYDDFYSIIGERFKDSTKYKGLKGNRKPKLISFGRGAHSELFKQLYESKEILEAGGILHILGDGMHGMSNVNIEFLGKIRGFRSSFAELGILAGSPIIPVFAVPGKKGTMHVEFLEPLNQGNDTMDHQVRVQQIIEQYSKILEEKWKENPSFISGGFMEMYNKQITIKE